jgi:predicted DNA-binding transcriptional regulator YafY
MRADRLLSILLLLQVHGKLTAHELAQELEVSVRTIYRDIDALSFAGIPIYSEPGHQGGYALIDNYRTNLTGLTRDELRALFMLGSLVPLADLGVSEELQGALLKIRASASQNHRHEEERIQQCFHFDSTWWRQSEGQIPHLQVVQQAVWQNRKLLVTYHPPFALEINRLIEPYGLVAKAGRWYLVLSRNDSLHVQRVSEFSDVRMLEETFERPGRFILAEFWQKWCADYEQYLVDFSVDVRVSPGFIPILPRYFGDSIRKKVAQAGSPDAKGWIRLTLSFESFEAARDRILCFGSGVEVLEPIALRKSVIDFAEQTLGLYDNGG